jgi:hypothetical protein
MQEADVCSGSGTFSSAAARPPRRWPCDQEACSTAARRPSRAVRRGRCRCGTWSLGGCCTTLARAAPRPPAWSSTRASACWQPRRPTARSPCWTWSRPGLWTRWGPTRQARGSRPASPQRLRFGLGVGACVAWGQPKSRGERRLARRRASTARGAGVHAIAYAEGGDALLTAGAGALRAWRWEPGRRAGSVPAAWPAPAALAAGGGRVLAAAMQGPLLSLWRADAHAVRPPTPAGVRARLARRPQLTRWGTAGAGPGGGGHARGAGARHAARACAAAQLRGAQGGRARRRAQRPGRLLRACTCAPRASSPCRPRLRSVLSHRLASGRGLSVPAGEEAPRGRAPAALARGASPAGAPRCFCVTQALSRAEASQSRVCGPRMQAPRIRGAAGGSGRLARPPTAPHRRRALT